MSHNEISNHDISRRKLLKKLSMAATLSCLPLSVQAKMSLADKENIREFLKLSHFLTAIHLDLSYEQLATDMLYLLFLDKKFNVSYSSLLNDFIKENEAFEASEKHKDPITKILKAWYLSQVTLSPEDLKNPEVLRICGNLRQENHAKNSEKNEIIGQISYNEALTWHACAFTKPSAICGGPFGYWALPPS